MISLNFSWDSMSLRVGDHEVGVKIPDAIGEALDGFNPGTYTDHSEVPEVTLPVKAGE